MEYEEIALKKIWKILEIENYEQTKGKSVDEWVESLKQQRDDLLVVCKDARATFVGYVEGSFAGQILKKMDAAIAKCEA